MSDLRDLYQELILDHSRSPRNRGELPGATHEADGFNPLCGDKIKIYLAVEDGVVRDARFQGSGCAISTASASLLTEAVKGKTVEETEGLFQRMHELLTGARNGGEMVAPDLGKLQVFSGVREFPARVKCATLSWHTLRAALDRQADLVSTE